jgi:hypothetical protein
LFGGAQAREKFEVKDDRAAFIAFGGCAIAGLLDGLWRDT